MKKNKPWEQLAKYFAGELSELEHRKMEKWIKEYPDREEQVNRLYKIWKESENPPYQLDEDRAWNNLSADMDEFEQSKKELASMATGTRNVQDPSYSNQSDKKVHRSEGIARRVMLVAAIVLLVVSAGVFSYYMNGEQGQTDMAQTERRTLITKNGERATYVLADGSRVILHAGSHLEIPDSYGENNRQLFLQGEAYFEVTHDPQKPFIVHSKNAYTRVLGTRFLVQAWPNPEERVEVVVSEGKVAFGGSINQVNGNQGEVIITRNQKATLANGQKPELAEVADMTWYLGWTEGRLVFKNRSLNEVIPRLERWYAIEIEMEDERIGQQRITAEIDYSQSMREVLQGIALTLDLDMEMIDRTVIFRGKG